MGFAFRGCSSAHHHLTLLRSVSIKEICWWGFLLSWGEVGGLPCAGIIERAFPTPFEKALDMGGVAEAVMVSLLDGSCWILSQRGITAVQCLTQHREAFISTCCTLLIVGLFVLLLGWRWGEKTPYKNRPGIAQH